ncbi:MAG: asparagine synthetase B, partial [bacterium]
MCGFITWLGENPDLKSLEKGSRLLKHRGPDDHGSWSDPSKNIVFKHRRLSIIDIEHGQQPYCYRGNSIIYNGETYNYRDLRAQLKTAGFKFETDSDTEVIAHLLVKELLKH